MDSSAGSTAWSAPIRSWSISTQRARTDDFPAARRCALWLRDLLESELNLTCYVKTTGGKGLHVHLPLNRREDFEEARGFARDAANVLAARHPDVVTTEQRKDARGGRVYADIMRDGSRRQW